MSDTELLLEARVALNKGDLAAAERACQTLLTSDPTNAEALLIMAVVSLRGGSNSIGLKFLREHLHAYPDSVEGHAMTSSVLFRMNQPVDARKHGRMAIELDFNNPVVWSTYARDLANSSSISEADNVLDEAIQKHVEDQTFLAGLSDSLVQCDKARFAVRAFERAIVSNTEQFAPLLVLGQLRHKARDLNGAIEAAKEAARCNPSSLDAFRLLANALSDRGDGSDAAEVFERMLQLDSNDLDALFGLGLYRQQQGDLEEAKELLQRAVEVRPTHGAAQYSLIRLYNAGPNDGETLQELGALAEDSSVHSIDRSYLYFAIGKGREDRGEFEKAMRAYDLAAAINFEYWSPRVKWNRERERQFAERITATVTSEFIANLQTRGLTDESPVLIVGMPRSGTSLVEQILSSHPDVFGAGEVFFWFEPAHTLLSMGQSIHESKLFQYAQEYLAVLEKAGGGARRITDKMPQNYLVLGLICAALPRARVIHVRRNPIDTCLSIYTTAFGEPAIYSHRREDIVFAYREYLRLMDHWRIALPAGQMLEIVYEQLVADYESTTRRMIEFLGLPWDDKCLHHDRNRRAVETSSVWQVRQPIYTSSVHRSDRFRPWLGEFLELEGL